MASPRISPELEETIRVAFDSAGTRGHEFVTLEHLLLALAEDKQTARVINACGGNSSNLITQLEEFLEESMESLPEGLAFEPQQTLAVERVLQRAAIHAISSQMDIIHGASVLVQVFKEQDSHAVYLLLKEGLNLLQLKKYISHGVRPDGGTDEPVQTRRRLGQDPSSSEEDLFGEEETADDPLEAYATDLIAEAEAGRIDPLIGRDLELDRTIQVLCRRRKNNPVFVGEPGVGKTALAEGLALRVHEKKVPKVLDDAKIFSLDMGALLAGTKFRGQFEERLKGVVNAIQEFDNAILFIDEIHTIVGAGSTTGSSMDASNLLKPALASGRLRCMGSTTFADYKHLERDRALARRFQKIDIVEPTEDESVAILQGLKPRYEEHHDVKYTDDAIEAAVSLAKKHIVERFLPDKAIDVIDEAGSQDRIRGEADRTRKVTVSDIEKVVSKMARVPVEQVSSNERDALRDLGPTLRGKIFGQDGAVESLVDAITLSRAGLRADHKPIGSFLFAGPTGVGKTELAKQLALAMGVQLTRFDMSEYSDRHTVSRLIGAPPGFVGFDQGGLLTDAVRKHPFSVVVLDEIEKAHPELFNILLQVMDHAKLTDNKGREADFRNVVLIMTTNAGASEAEKNTVGFSSTGKMDGLADSRTKAALEKTFTPEFRNRIDAVVNFTGLSKEVIRMVVDKEVSLLEAQLSASSSGARRTGKTVRIELSNEARDWLAEKGYDPKMGARPMARLVEQSIKKPLAKALVFGGLVDGGVARFVVKDGELILQSQA